ncbi:AAA family ATPase [uncultured Tateyamaria sp.]|uniref:AAA family ATPase n=1 Tax=uncultured Tateyamaria sp. TaxID=455651 RepID=UPI002623D81A|nr:AAA family ATPase [uncultured Tateyamaria sp.]
MILEGNERAYGAELARHLLNPRDNDHVTVHMVDGFLAQDLFGAFAEAEAIATGTRCQKYLFSLSLNPPSSASVCVETFEATIASVERELGLVGQPKAIVFHEKNGRRHAHCVWSKIDASQMKAINLSHYKRKLFGLSRDLYLEHDWDMPDGFKERGRAKRQNYSRAEGQQAKRAQRDPQAQKAMFAACWAASDNRASFEAALRDQGYVLARGARRGFVAVDADGKVWSLSRWTGVRAKELRRRLGPEADCPSIADVRGQLAGLARPKRIEPDHQFEAARAALVQRQKEERAALLAGQLQREAARLHAAKQAQPKGVRAAFLRMTGRYDAVVQTLQTQAAIAKETDRAEQDRLIERHLAERRALDQERQRAQARSEFDAARRDPRQTLVLPEDDIPFSTAQLKDQPGRIVDYLSHTKASFGRADVMRALAKRFDDPMALQALTKEALTSPELVDVPHDGSPRYTTRDYQRAVATVEANAATMQGQRGVAVSSGHAQAAMQSQDRAMQHAFGGKLSTEQRDAVTHVLSASQLTSVVGLAGAGKSTMLATARDAWARQGITVHGAALAGKAADGLETASGIKSRTLASLETSWANGHAPIANGDVLVVDEAGMIGTRQMARVTSKLNEIGAKLVLVGDPDQLQPIEAGTPFRDLVDKHGAAQLTEIHRQRADWQKQASKDLAAGKPQRLWQPTPSETMCSKMRPPMLQLKC